MDQSTLVEHLYKILPKDAIEKVTGKLLGDGNISVEKGKRGRFRFTHSAKDMEWSEHCYNELKANLPLNPPIYRKITDKRTIKGFTECYYVQSRTAIPIDVLRNLWYYKNIKVLPKELLYRSLTPLTLAWWYMDDGHLKLKNDIATKLVLSTESFTQQELHFLQKILLSKFFLHFKIDKESRLVLYDKPSICYFLKLVKSHLIPGMSRKYLQAKKDNLNTGPKRTSIYLPTYFKILTPTKEFNDVISYSRALQEQLITTVGHIQFYKTYVNTQKQNRKSYQIIISNDNLYRINELQYLTGFEKSVCVQACFDFANRKGRLYGDDQ